MAKKKKEFGLTTMKSGLATSASDFMKEVQAELVKEEQDSFKDFLKAAYRVILEKQKEVERLQGEIGRTQEILAQAEKGKWQALEGLKIPARFFKEEVLRKHGKSLVAGSEELRFMDLYVPQDEE
jgi:hypothetical protein